MMGNILKKIKKDNEYYEAIVTIINEPIYKYGYPNFYKNV